MRGDVNKNCILLVSTLASFLPAYISSAINIALPAMGSEFSMDAVLLGWIPTAYLLSMAIFMVPLGRSADIYGRERVFCLGVILFTAFSFLSAFPGSSLGLIGLRFLQGVGSAMIFSTAVAILTAAFPPGQRGKVLGINVTSVYLGLSLGPVLGGFLVGFFGWRSIFLITVPPGLVVLALVLRYMDLRGTGSEGRSQDLGGFLVYSMLLSSLIYGLSQLPEAKAWGFLGFGLLCLLVFTVLESRSRDPMVDLVLFRENRAFAWSNLATLINYSATFAVAFIMSLYLQLVQGRGPEEAGLILISQPLVQAAFSPMAGTLSDRIQPRYVASAGMAITALALALLATLGEDTGQDVVIAFLVLLGFGLALFSSPNTNAIMSSVGPRQLGLASGMVGTMRTVGMMLSMALVMLIFNLVLGRVLIEPQNYPQLIISMELVFRIFAVLCALGTLASLIRGKVKSTDV